MLVLQQPFKVAIYEASEEAVAVPSDAANAAVLRLQGGDLVYKHLTAVDVLWWAAMIR